MTHLTSLSAGVFSTLAYVAGSTPITGANNAALATAWDGVFATPAEVAHVRDFPAMGAPANIVKVPEYGHTQSLQVQGQSDAPSLELTLNYYPNLWSDGSANMLLIKNNTVCYFRFALMSGTPIATGNLLATDNTCYYWIGKMESILVKASLTDATTATLTLSMQSDFYGAFTHAPAP